MPAKLSRSRDAGLTAPHSASTLCPLVQAVNSITWDEETRRSLLAQIDEYNAEGARMACELKRLFSVHPANSLTSKRKS